MTKQLDNVILEACIDSFSDAVSAVKNGAHQLEVCSRLDLDGLTPDFKLVKAISSEINVPLKIMIRPRPGGFVYDRSELDQMLTSIQQIKALGIGQVVLGALTTRRTIDLTSVQLLAEWAYPMKITFHKAIDLVDDPISQIKLMKGISNIQYILTSGQAQSAVDGIDFLRKMIQELPDFTIIAAGKITKHNLRYLHEEVGASIYHGRKIV